MSGVKEIYNSILFLEKWQRLISDITKYTVTKLNEASVNSNNKSQFDIGPLYPPKGIKYGNYITYKNETGIHDHCLYFGFNFNLYNKDNIKHYPKFDIIGEKLNNLNNSFDNYPKELEHFIKAKQEEIIDEYIFGLSLNKACLSERMDDELFSTSLMDIDNFYYIPIETHLLYLDENVSQISLQIINICKKYLLS